MLRLLCAAFLRSLHADMADAWSFAWSCGCACGCACACARAASPAASHSRLAAVAAIAVAAVDVDLCSLVGSAWSCSDSSSSAPTLELLELRAPGGALKSDDTSVLSPAESVSVSGSVSGAVSGSVSGCAFRCVSVSACRFAGCVVAFRSSSLSLSRRCTPPRIGGSRLVQGCWTFPMRNAAMLFRVLSKWYLQTNGQSSCA